MVALLSSLRAQRKNMTKNHIKIRWKTINLNESLVIQANILCWYRKGFCCFLSYFDRGARGRERATGGDLCDVSKWCSIWPLQCYRSPLSSRYFSLLPTAIIAHCVVLCIVTIPLTIPASPPITTMPDQTSNEAKWRKFTLYLFVRLFIKACP